jgi:PST family polysaccharide transporter
MATPVRTIWQGFVRGSLGTGVAIVARAAGALGLNKLVALYGGPGGLTQLAQFQNLMAIFGALPTDGVQVGATTRLAPLRPGSGRHRAWLGAALLLTGLAVVGAGAVLLATGGAAWPAGQAALFAVGMLLITTQALLSTALLAAGRRGPYVMQAVAISVLGTAAVAATLVAGRPLRQVLLAYLGGQALTLPLAVWAARRAGLLGGWRWHRPSAVAGRGLLPFLLMAAGALVCGRAVDYGLRAWLIAHFAPARTDLWQAVAKLSDNYTLVMGAVLNTVFYPRLAALTASPAQARRYLEAVLGLLAGGLALALGLVYALRDVLLPLLFAPRLLAARELLAPQLFGDWAKFMAWVFLYYLLARARPLPYLAMQAVGAVLYVAALLALVPLYGLQGVVWAYALYYTLLLLLCAGLYKWQWN